MEFGFGTAWEFSGNASATSGKANSKQVTEQSGLFAGEGGYHINANNVHLEGGAIASTNPSQSELSTNTLTFNDIQNESGYRATSAAISGGYSNSDGISGSPTLPMHEQGNDNSITKATLTEGNITLNKDSQPTQTTAKALGINTELDKANEQVEAPKDIAKVLKEQQVITQSVGQITSAVDSFTNNLYQEAKEREEKAKKEVDAARASGDKHKIEVAQQIYREAVKASENWEIGGKYKQAADAITATLSLTLAGKPTEAILAGGVSPYINQAIKEITKNTPELNIPTHILWGAVESHLKGGNAISGAIAVGVGEITADYLVKELYQKDPRELSETEKQQIIELSQLTSIIASGFSFR
ncbi:hypothetical protein H0G77_00495 [[Pasteurella] aerogenes]|nr:hypothetical protein [[Pasteurella] aerogenes]